MKPPLTDRYSTQLPAIENELYNYWEGGHFKDKVIFCNCDDPIISKFFHYFSYNFENLGLKKLMATCYKNTDAYSFSNNESARGLYIEYNGDKNGNRIPDDEEIDKYILKGNGDFSSSECIDLLKQSDVVVTAPPYNKVKDYILEVIKHKKKFLVLGHAFTAVAPRIFPFIKDKKIWLGAGNNKGNSWWFTNMKHGYENPKILLYKTYTEKEYPKYDNYNAINVKYKRRIPKDYDGIMGVPLSYLSIHNPKQFRLVGVDFEVSKGLLPQIVNPDWTGQLASGQLNGKKVYTRLFIQRRKDDEGKT